MLTAEGCAARRERLWEALPSPCDVLIVGDPSHLTYFAGYAPSPFVFRTVESGALLLLEPGRATLVADDMLGPFRRPGASSMSGSRPSGTTGSIRPPIAGASSSHRRWTGWRRCPGGGSASSWRRSGGGGRGPARGTAGPRDRRHRPADPPVAAGEGRGRDRRRLRRSMRAGEAAQAAALAEVRPGHDRARRLPDRPERGDDRAVGRAGDRLRRLRLGPALCDAKRAGRRRRERSSRATCCCSTSR